MHLIMMVTALTLAWWLRVYNLPNEGSWMQRWQRALFLFLFPPLLLVMTGLAVICMGPQGQMVGLPASWFTYLLTLSWFGVMGGLCLKLAWQGWRSVQQLRTYPSQDLGSKSSRVLETPALYSALVGFWQPELVISRGIIETLTPAQLDAVIAHEQAHECYRDTFWFFWLGCVRSCTAWLPNTEALWQELLLLRELRADRWAAEQVDPLVLAESLLLVVSHPLVHSESFCAAFSALAPTNRLQQRIEALLSETELTVQPRINWSWIWLCLAFLPLATVPFHT